LREVSGGPSHACGISIARALLCWGFSPDARAFIQPGSPFALTVPPPVASVRSVSTGESFSCFITLGGVQTCSGNDELSVVTGGNDAAGIPVGSNGYASIATGQRHGCGMPSISHGDAGAVPRPSRTPLCWGANGEGQLGMGTITAFEPVPAAIASALIAGGAIAEFDSTSIVAGALHSCALSAPGGVAFCWGSNGFGQLGKGGVSPPPAGSRDSVPILVASPVQFQRLFAGEYHTCGLTTEGVAYCWGRNDRGQLGTGGPSNPLTSATAVSTTMTFRALALGENFTCGITGAPGPTGTTSTAGVVFCWGDNEYGQLGLGTFGANGLTVNTPTRSAFQQ
jgi:hypothetical protein